MDKITTVGIDLAKRVGTYGQPASTGLPLKLHLSIANGVDEFVDACIAGLATLVVLEVLQCLFFITKRQIRHADSVSGIPAHRSVG